METLAQKALEKQIQSSYCSPHYRTYNIHFTEWNGIKKLYQTKARSKDEAINNFWHSGVKFGAFIDSID